MSVDEALDSTIPEDYPKADRAFVQTLTFGVLRWFWQLQDSSRKLLKKPLRQKEQLVLYVLLTGLYQIQHLNTPAHAAVADTVKCCKELGKDWAKGLINACLRQYLRNTKQVNHSTHYSHPSWMIERIQQAWPEQAKAIFAANNAQAPMCLRVNTRKTSREEYLELLDSAEIKASPDSYSSIGIRLGGSQPVNHLPHFMDGWVSVQDTASQMIANILPVEAKQRVLDACAAPGGKTALLLEQCDNKAEVDALDVGGKRNLKLAETLDRLQLSARILSGDASNSQPWWDNKHYDRILLDAPCSGTGVIRRHPDIKHHRTPRDVEQLVALQQQILVCCWELLANDGLLLYTTCSIFPEENDQQISQFISQHPQAKVIEFDHPTALQQQFGQQTLPGISDMDGFYYCLIRKVTE